MSRLVTIVVVLALGGCMEPQEQTLKRLPVISAQVPAQLNCTTQYVGNGYNKTSYTTCN